MHVAIDVRFLLSPNSLNVVILQPYLDAVNYSSDRVICSHFLPGFMIIITTDEVVPGWSVDSWSDESSTRDDVVTCEDGGGAITEDNSEVDDIWFSEEDDTWFSEVGSAVGENGDVWLGVGLTAGDVTGSVIIVVEAIGAVELVPMTTLEEADVVGAAWVVPFGEADTVEFPGVTETWARTVLWVGMKRLTNLLNRYIYPSRILAFVST